MNRVFKDEKGKEFICRHCGNFLNANELKDGKCPICENDEGLYVNDQHYE